MHALLSSKVFLVTGGAAGIGLVITSLLLDYGSYVYVTDVHEEQSAELSDLQRLKHIQGDVRDRTRSHEIIVSIIKQHHHLDGLVNNAGLCLEEGDLPSDNMYDKIFDVNVRGAWNLGTEALVQMKAQGEGSIVNIGSLASLVGEERLPIYTATKHALAGFTKTWALDFAKHGIRVNMVAPGATDTKMVRRTLKKVMGPVYGADKTEDELLEHVKKHIPLGRLGEPRDVANSVIFFLSSLSSFVTGQVLVVGGGA